MLAKEIQHNEPYKSTSDFLKGVLINAVAIFPIAKGVYLLINQSNKIQNMQSIGSGKHQRFNKFLRETKSSSFTLKFSHQPLNAILHFVFEELIFHKK